MMSTIWKVGLGNGNKRGWVPPFYLKSELCSTLLPREFEQNKSQLARQRLLIWEKRDVILRTIMENQVTIISGDTGCGKTTQLPYPLDHKQMMSTIWKVGLGNGNKRGWVPPFYLKGELCTTLLPREFEQNKSQLCGLVGRIGPLGVSGEGYKMLKKVQMLQGNYDSNFEIEEPPSEVGDNAKYKVELGEILLIGEVLAPHNMPIEEFLEKGIEYPKVRWLIKKVGELSKREVVLGEHHEMHDHTAEVWVSEPMDHAMSVCLEQYEEVNFSHVINLIESEYVSVDYHHTPTYMTPLMIQKLVGKHLKVLVFLPHSYDDIIRLRSMLLQDQNILHKIHIFMLHGSAMQPFEQRKVFRKAPYGIRKIILSTDIAETSLTVDDVMFVIDSGRIEERLYDPAAGINKFTTQWITKKNAHYRKSRAGRFNPGVCYHLFSKDRYKTLKEEPPAEMFKVSLSEIALNTKVLAPHNMPIEEFLSKGIESPPVPALKKAVGELSRQEALTQWEELTTVGKHLSELPIDPHLGKVVLYSVILKCLDPVCVIFPFLRYGNEISPVRLL
eukprot:sb/3479508/